MWSPLPRFPRGYRSIPAVPITVQTSNSDTTGGEVSGEQQTMDHIVDLCPITILDGGLLSLHEADDDAISWLKMMATKAPYLTLPYLTFGVDDTRR